MNRLAAVGLVIGLELALAAGCASNHNATTPEGIRRTFHIVKVLEGEFDRDTLTITDREYGRGVRIIGIDRYENAAPEPKGPEAIRMVLAFQLAPGKTPSDFAKFKALDLPWVAANHGSNRATIWTQRTEDWPYDAFEDVTFASRADFERAYAGNEELAKAGEGLFGDRVLVAIVEE
jgi:hypothetical protein